MSEPRAMSKIMYLQPSGYTYASVILNEHASGFDWNEISRNESIPRLLDGANWWRCDSCGRAVDFRKDGALQLKCPDCSASIPKRYDR